MIVVSDTTPIISLMKAGQMKLLYNLTKAVNIALEKIVMSIIILRSEMVPDALWKEYLR